MALDTPWSFMNRMNRLLSFMNCDNVFFQIRLNCKFSLTEIAFEGFMNCSILQKSTVVNVLLWNIWIDLKVQISFKLIWTTIIDINVVLGKIYSSTFSFAFVSGLLSIVLCVEADDAKLSDLSELLVEVPSTLIVLSLFGDEFSSSVSFILHRH